MSRESTLVILSGVPGSGKSTYAKNFAILCKELQKELVIVNPDSIRKEQFGSYWCPEHETEVWRIVDEMVRDGSETAEFVIVDATALTDKTRMRFWNNWRRYFDRTNLIIFIVDFDECLKRNHQRPEEKWVPENVVREMYERFQPEPSDAVKKSFDIIYFIDDIANEMRTTSKEEFYE